MVLTAADDFCAGFSFSTTIEGADESESISDICFLSFSAGGTCTARLAGSTGLLLGGGPLPANFFAAAVDAWLILVLSLSFSIATECLSLSLSSSSLLSLPLDEEELEEDPADFRARLSLCIESAELVPSDEDERLERESEPLRRLPSLGCSSSTSSSDEDSEDEERALDLDLDLDGNLFRLYFI